MEGKRSDSGDGNEEEKSSTQQGKASIQGLNGVTSPADRNDREPSSPDGAEGSGIEVETFEHIYSNVAHDPENRLSKDSDEYNALFDSQLELPDLNDLIDSPLVPPTPREFTLTRSSSGVVFGNDGNTVQIEEDSIHSFDTESDSRSLLLNDTLTEVSDICCSATTCQGSDNDFYTLPDDDNIEPIYEEIPFMRHRKRDKPAARGSGISSEDTICSDEVLVDCHLASKVGESAESPDARAVEYNLPVPDSDVIYQSVKTSSRIGSATLDSKPRDDTMAFFKRSFAKVRLDLLFRKKKNHKFVECVEKVIEARRSGCIDEDGNIVKTLDEQLKARGKKKSSDKKKKQQKSPALTQSNSDADKRPEAEIKPQSRVMGVSNPNYRESYPLPEEDDGSEGYESASEVETVDSNGGGSVQDRTSPRLSGILSNRSSQHESDENSVDAKPVVRRASSRRVRFSDEVEEFDHIHGELVGKPPRDFSGGHGHRIVVSSEPEPVQETDNCVLSLTKKISLFENMSKQTSNQDQNLHPKLSRTTGHRHSDPGPARDSMKPDPAEFPTKGEDDAQNFVSITRARVQAFEKLSLRKPGERKVPKPKPRTSLLEIKMNQTKQKIMFFEQLKSGMIKALQEEG